MSEFVPDVQAALERLEALVGKYGSSFDQNAIGTLKAALSDVHIPGGTEVDAGTYLDAMKSAIPRVQVWTNETGEPGTRGAARYYLLSAVTQ